MPAIVEFPLVVREALCDFGDLFACEPQRRHFAEYPTGLMVASNKTVTGINGEFADTTDQSCLNRFLTEVDWDERALNERRLELLQHDPSTRSVGDLKTNRKIQVRGRMMRARHTYLVMLAYSLLVSQLKGHHAKDWALRRLTTIGEACRAMTTETLRTALQWAIEKVTQDSKKTQSRVRLIGGDLKVCKSSVTSYYPMLFEQIYR